VGAHLNGSLSREALEPTGGEEMRCYKKAMFRTAITGTLAMVSLAMGLVTEASAGCPNLPGFNAGAAQPMSW